MVSITTPGEVIGAIVSQEGIAINPKRTDLISKVDAFLKANPSFKLNLKTIQELKAHGEKMAGRKYEVPDTESDKIVGVIEWRDGTVIDVVRAVKNKKSKYPKTANDVYISSVVAGTEGQENVIEVNSLEQPIIPIAEQKEILNNLLNFYGLENKGINISYGDFSCEKWVFISRFEAEIKSKLKDKIAPELLSKPYLLPEEYITEIQKTVQFDKFRLRRSNHYIPGNDPKVVAKCGELEADCTILDLEDAVHPKNKASARILVRNALRHLNWKTSERAIRIN